MPVPDEPEFVPVIVTDVPTGPLLLNEGRSTRSREA
jgi:hypothetical protein